METPQENGFVVNKGQEPIVPTDIPNMITITIANLIKGRPFYVNEQYLFSEEITIQVGCGCGGKPKKDVLHYRVRLNNVDYDIPSTFSVRSQQVIPAAGKDFAARRANLGDTQEVSDFNQYRQINSPTHIRLKANISPM